MNWTEALAVLCGDNGPGNTVFRAGWPESKWLDVEYAGADGTGTMALNEAPLGEFGEPVNLADYPLSTASGRRYRIVLFDEDTEDPAPFRLAEGDEQATDWQECPWLPSAAGAGAHPVMGEMIAALGDPDPVTLEELKQALEEADERGEPWPPQGRQPLQQIGGAIATLSGSGTSADQAAQDLRSTIEGLNEEAAE